MNIRVNVPLKDLTAMQLGGPSRFVCDVTSKDELVGVVKRAQEHKLPFFVMGGGSNIIATDEGYDGLLILIKIPGFDIIEEDRESIKIKIGAGEPWDNIVKRTVDSGLSGIECLSGIPGTAGGTPVQNVGAYGQEIAESLVELE